MCRDILWTCTGEIQRVEHRRLRPRYKSATLYSYETFRILRVKLQVQLQVLFSSVHTLMDEKRSTCAAKRRQHRRRLRSVCPRGSLAVAQKISRYLIVTLFNASSTQCFAIGSIWNVTLDYMVTTCILGVAPIKGPSLTAILSSKQHQTPWVEPSALRTGWVGNCE